MPIGGAWYWPVRTLRSPGRAPTWFRVTWFSSDYGRDSTIRLLRIERSNERVFVFREFPGMGLDADAEFNQKRIACWRDTAGEESRSSSRQQAPQLARSSVRISRRLAAHQIRRALTDFVWMPLMPRQQTPGNVISLDRLCLRIPVHMVLSLHGNPVQQASGTGAMANLCRRYRRIS